MFVDKARISVKAGRGGNGSVSFHREKFVAAGGPDGGDGGRGGNIILKTDVNMSTLMDFRYRRKYVAENGADGAGKMKTGKDGAALIIKVPNGTVIRDTESGAIIKDMTGTDEYILSKGGNGGWGNKHFATPTRQAPRFAKAGLPGQEFDITLELKLIADVGLIGFPNVGKSTLLSVVSNAHPKIADYHFTTLYPNLGVIFAPNGTSFVMADIPGIIEGASEGAGLGHDFLRHVDRCRLLVHIVDASGSEGRNPIADFQAINEELRHFNEELSHRPQIVALGKCDLIFDRDSLTELKRIISEQGYRVFELSAVTGEGVRELISKISEELSKLPPITVFEPDYVPKAADIGTAEEVSVEVIDDVWILEGKWLDRLVSNVNFSDNESKLFFDRILRDSGLFERLVGMGIAEDDTVSLCNMEFEWKN